MMRAFGLIASAISLLFAGPIYAQQSPPRVSGAPQFGLTPGAVPSAALTEAINRADLELFDTYFIQCNWEKMNGLVTEDLQFFHDKSGYNAKSGAEFVANMKRGCERQAAGTDFRARRVLDEASVQVYPLNNYGALSMGKHRFYARIPGKPDTLTETGKFITVWRKDGEQWKIARAISYDHVLAK